jgi:5-(carboxyamino)imidazole ribonucleotide synthase
MMYEASIGLDLEFHLLAEEADGSAAKVAHHVTVGDYTDREVLYRFAQNVDAVTFDHEHVPTDLLRELVGEGTHVRPGPGALENAQDKGLMRANLSSLMSAPMPAWRICETESDLRDFGDEIGWPIIAKTTRGGYDGHGVWKLAGLDDCGIPFKDLAQTSAGARVQIMGEEFVDFARELSVIVVRGVDGQVVSYPVSETVQEHGICVETCTPAPDMTPVQSALIQDLGRRIAETLDVVGILAVELMQRRDGSVVVNELAMRPHNTGHWSLGGALTSQFENHLRAVAGLPLGETRALAPVVVMHNILGGAPDMGAALESVQREFPQAKVELYGKSVRPGRKLGHVTVLGDDAAETRRIAASAANRLMGKQNKEER